MVRSWLALLVLFILTAPALCACDAAADAPAPTLRVEDVLAGPAGAAFFPQTAVGATAILLVEVVNSGGGTVTLTASPPVRLERDDVLAFALTQPEDRTLAAGAATRFMVEFSPRAPGTATARLVIPTDAPGRPELTLDLAGEGLAAGQPGLTLAVDDTVAPSAWHFVATATDARTTVTLRLTNSGDGRLSFPGADALAVTGPDAYAFTASTPAPATLEPGETATASLAFAPTRCGAHTATLTLASDATGAPHALALDGAGVVSPQRFPDVADTSLLDVPDLTLLVSADGRYVAVANPAAATFAGAAAGFTFDGCALTPTFAVTAADAGYSGSLFASAAALSADGATLLVTARDHATAWLFDTAAGADGSPVTLTTADGGAGHGRAAALTPDASVAVIGQPLASAGAGAHGAVFAWLRPDGGWTPQDEATVKLLPTDLARAERLGQTLAVSADAGVIAAAALLTGPDGRSAAGACVYLRDGATWGRERLITNTRVRNPSATLRASAGAAAPVDAMVRVAVTADGATLAFSAAESGGSIALYLFEANGDGSFGVPDAASEGDAPATFHESARVRLSGSPSWRFALAPDGAFLLGGDAAGVHQLDRPAGGWTAAVEPVRSWPLPAFGDLALGQGGAFIATLARDGALQILWR